MERDYARPEFVHFYGDWIWGKDLTGWIKSLLLFFDGIALGIPHDVANYLIESDPYLAQPLIEQGLLRNFVEEIWPTQSFDDPAYELVEIADKYNRWEGVDPSEGIIPMRQLLGMDEELRFIGWVVPRAFLYIDRLDKMGDRTAKYYRAFLVSITSMMLAQSVTDVAIQPIINDEDAARFVASAVGSLASGKRADVVVADIASVGIDLSAVPLDEVLDFRSKYGSEYRAYSKDIREFALMLSLMTESDQITAIAARRAELKDRRARLRRIGRQSFKGQSISLGLGLAGAAWTLAHGDTWGAAIAAGQIAAAATISKSSLSSIGAAYTYIFRAANELAR